MKKGALEWDMIGKWVLVVVVLVIILLILFQQKDSIRELIMSLGDILRFGG